MVWGWDSFFQGLIFFGGSSVVGVAVKGLFDRKRTSVDASAQLSNAALAQVVASDKRSADAERRMDEMAEDMLKLRVALRHHDAWDRLVVKKLHDAGIDIDDPPEIWVL